MTTQEVTQIPASELKAGDRMIVSLFEDFECTVESVTQVVGRTGRPVWQMGSTSVRMLRITFTDAPKPIKALEMSEGKSVAVAR